MNKLRLCSTVLLVVLSSPIWAAGSPLPKPVFAEGLTRRMVLIFMNVPETLLVRSDSAEASGSASTLNATEFELQDVDAGLWYNDSAKNQYILQGMIRRGKGIWMANILREQFSSAKWYGNMYNLDVTLWYNSPDNKKRVSRKLSTNDGTFLEQLQALDTQVRPGELRLDLNGISSE